METPLSMPLSSQETQALSVRAQKLTVIVGCELAGAHVAPGVAQVQALAG